jgi:Kelch motif
MYAQNPGQFYQELSPMPEAVTNNAVCTAKANDTAFVYSFMGLDSSKIWSGIHLKAWRYNTRSGEWLALPPVPDPSGGLIAGAASTVKNKIYVIGGYHVAQNGNETSSDRVHRFDPETNSWLSGGAPIPKAIDDQVQAVWRDSLIFVVTGWSNSTNVADVQIYNPTTDTWLAGTPVPNDNSYKAFGASGIIHGDTLYYIGGARTGTNFPVTTVLRKGYIDPNNPTQITWSAQSTAAAKGYRMAVAKMAGLLVWIGGSDVTYNYNGIAYNGSGGIAALARVKTYGHQSPLAESIAPDFLPKIMDLRGVAQINTAYFITAGGMGPGQKVTNKVYGYTWAVTTAAHEGLHKGGFKVSPNPAKDYVVVAAAGPAEIQLANESGTVIRQSKGADNIRMQVGDLMPGAYWLLVWSEGRLLGVEKIVLAR